LILRRDDEWGLQGAPNEHLAKKEQVTGKEVEHEKIALGNFVWVCVVTLMEFFF